MNSKTALPLALATCAFLTLSSCDTPEGRGAVYGATAGAVVGNLVNPQASTTLRGAAIGAGVGALAGALVGEASRNSNYYRNDPEYYNYYNERYQYGAYPAPRRGYPYATYSSSPGFVRSPYAPYNVIDVRGVPSGAMVVDPSTDRVFLCP